MNIKEHIEAGHYPTDDKGRALVPMRNGTPVPVLATDIEDGSFQIIGFRPGYGAAMWTAEGRFHAHTSGNSPYDLFAPLPRKVKVARWLVHCTPRYPEATFSRRADAEAYAIEAESRLIQLTGEYEEPWS